MDTPSYNNGDTLIPVVKMEPGISDQPDVKIYQTSESVDLQECGISTPAQRASSSDFSELGDEPSRIEVPVTPVTIYANCHATDSDNPIIKVEAINPNVDADNPQIRPDNPDNPQIRPDNPDNPQIRPDNPEMYERTKEAEITPMTDSAHLMVPTVGDPDAPVSIVNVGLFPGDGAVALMGNLCRSRTNMNTRKGDSFILEAPSSEQGSTNLVFVPTPLGMVAVRGNLVKTSVDNIAQKAERVNLVQGNTIGTEVAARNSSEGNCLSVFKKSHKCNWCEKRFLSAENCIVHARSHLGIKPFHCTLCGKQFTGRSGLRLHEKSHSSERPHGCSQCGKKFKDRQVLRKHLKTHTDEKNFMCPHCGARFKTKESLNKHVRNHTGKKPYKCSVCAKTFATASWLNSHMSVHSEEKPYICSVCERSYKEKSSLLHHMKAHSGEKSFACSLCDSKFVHQMALKEHMRTHTGEKPFACTVCDKKFNFQTNLSRHTKFIHSSGGPFYCPVCNKKYLRKNTFEAHLKTHESDS